MIKNITYEQIKTWEAQNVHFQLIDVREESEHNEFNIGGLLIPLADILKEKDKLEINKPIVFYCKRGIRSQIAIQKLSRFFPQGDFYNLKSGINFKS
jgi:rhodanese-related sulfurtransferase